MTHWNTAFIGLGGNIGDVVATMASALQHLDKLPCIRVSGVSPVYRTPPWGKTDQDWFHNACASLETCLQPIELLDECLKIEQIFGRDRTVRWGPRTVDLDVLLYEELSLKTERLELPHPRMLERAFVLKPLADLAPDMILAGEKLTIHLAAIDTDELDELLLPSNWWLKRQNP